MIAGLFTEFLALGGVQTAGRGTAAALACIAEGNGDAVQFLSLNDPVGEHEVCVGNLHFRFRAFGRNKIFFMLAALGVARSQPQVIFAAHPHLAPVASSVRRLARRSRVIVGTHGIEVWQSLSLLRRRALLRANVVLAPSSDTARKLVTVQSVPEVRIRTLPWPVSPEFLRFAESASSLPLPAGFPRGRVILSVARWSSAERYKGADLLIAAIDELASDFSELQLVLVGSGDDLPRLRELARQSRFPDRIHFLENVSPESLAAYYSNSEIFALPSTGEGFGLVFLEAMAMAKPVIGTRLGGIPDVVEDGCEGLLLATPEVPRLVAALRRLLTDISLSKEMGRRGRERVLRDFAFESFQHRLGNIFAEMRDRQ